MTSTTPAVIHVVDDDPSFRKAVSRMLETSGYQVVAYDSGRQYLDSVPQTEPSCILIDLKMAKLGGLELQQRLSVRGNMSPIIFLTGHGDIPTTVQALKGGADDFLTKPISKAALVDAVERALAHFAEKLGERNKAESMKKLISRLTPRELEVFTLVIRGKINKQIAHELGISERTVKAHRHEIMQKLEVVSLAEAVSIAERLGMLREPG